MPKVSRPRGTRRGEPLGSWGALFGTVPAILSPRSGHGAEVPGFERIEAPPAAIAGEDIVGSLADFVKALRTGEVPMNECHDNLASLAMVMAALESSRSGCRVAVER